MRTEWNAGISDKACHHDAREETGGPVRFAPWRYKQHAQNRPSREGHHRMATQAGEVPGANPSAPTVEGYLARGGKHASPGHGAPPREYGPTRVTRPGQESQAREQCERNEVNGAARGNEPMPAHVVLAWGRTSRHTHVCAPAASHACATSVR